MKRTNKSSSRDKTAMDAKYVVLGSSGNTGSIIADFLLSKGKKVRVVGRDLGRLQRFVRKGAEAYTADLSDAAALTKAFSGARAAYLLLPPLNSREEQERQSDAIAAAVKNSGPEEHFDKLFNINVRGTLFTVQKALPLLKDGGSIILNGSVASVKGTAAFGVYAASKAAIRSFVRTWTTDLKERRIRSNVVSPGPINTPLVSRQATDVIARIVSTIPMGRMGEPEEVAKVALFLASDDSSFVTGIELFVDGGRAQV